MNRLGGYIIAGALAALVAGGPGFAADAADPLAALETGVSAVLNTDGAPRLVLVEKVAGGDSARVLRVGDEYRDGWKLVSATPTAATLRKGAQTREVLFKSAAAAEAAQGAGGETGSIALTNAMVGGSPRPAPPPGLFVTPSAVQLQDARASIEAQYGANYLSDMAQRLGVSADRIVELTARGVPPPPPPPRPPVAPRSN